jgi:hypothetical protein
MIESGRRLPRTFATACPKLGTQRKCQRHRCISAIRGTADEICTLRAFQAVDPEADVRESISEDVLSEDQHYTRHEKQNQYDVGELRFVESPIELQPCPRAGEQHRQAKCEQPDHVA